MIPLRPMVPLDARTAPAAPPAVAQAAPAAGIPPPPEKSRPLPPATIAPAGRAPPAAPTGAEDEMERTVSSYSGVSDELAETLAELDRPTVRRKRRRKENRRFWFWHELKDSFLHSGRTVRLVLAWGQRWRRSASFRVVLAFALIYGLLAVVRKPSEIVIEQSRHTKDLAYLQGFLKSYAAAGGPVLAEKPFGGAELYPRGVVLQGELLGAFRRAPIGGTFVFRTTGPDGNPLAGFYGYPPIYAGGGYFHLDRKFNLSLYRFTFLVRKDSEQKGAILVARLELAY